MKEMCRPVVIHGERHSGTNAMRRWISDACPCSPFHMNHTHDYDGPLGWKHAETIQSIPESIVLIIMYRGAISWLRHMARDTYEAKYYRNGRPMDPTVVLPLLLTDTFPPEYASALEMRSIKYSRWHAVAQSHPNVIEVVYEDFVEAGGTFDVASRLHGIKCTPHPLKYVSRQTSQFDLPDINDTLLRSVYKALNFTLERELHLMV